MQPTAIQQTLRHAGDEHIVISTDAQRRAFLGVSQGRAEADDFLFIQIDRVTMLELQRGLVDVPTVVQQRCAGLVARGPLSGRVAGQPDHA